MSQNLHWQARSPASFRTASQLGQANTSSWTVVNTAGSAPAPNDPNTPRLLAPVQSPASDPFDDPFGDRQAQTAAAQNGQAPPLPVDEQPPAAAVAQRTAPQLQNPAQPLPGGVQRDPCEEQYRDYQGPDKDCLIAHCKLRSRPVTGISLNIDPRREPGYDPQRDVLPYECALSTELLAERHWVPTTFTWKASALCHKPLYFEEVQLERYGHSAGPLLQPAISGAHFFANIAVLPYKMGMYPPTECQYALGYYRPGSCAPWLIDPIPISLRGGLLQAGTVLGLIYAIP